LRLEKPVGEIRNGGGLGLTIIVEGLNSIGLEGSKAHPVLISPSLSHSPFSKEKAQIVVNKHKVISPAFEALDSSRA
jgi:hypothetical protein